MLGTMCTRTHMQTHKQSHRCRHVHTATHVQTQSHTRRMHTVIQCRYMAHTHAGMYAGHTHVHTCTQSHTCRHVHTHTLFPALPACPITMNFPYNTAHFF